MSDSSRIIDGKAFAEKLRAKIAEQVAFLKEKHGFTPGLAVVLVGEDPASKVYVRNKGEQTKAAGMASFEYKLPDTTSQAEMLALIDKLNKDPNVNGILCQLPVPKQIDPQAIINAIDPDKDVDGFHVVNAGKLATGGEGLVPCTPYGCLLLLKDRLGDLAGKHAVVIGRSNIVGKPMAQLLLNESCTVTIAHSKTKDLPDEVRRADIVVAAVGRPEMVKGDWIKEGATVIDVGINRIEVNGKGKLVGDVEYATALPRAAGITPVPGGVGPMTIGLLLRNTLVAACRQRGVKLPD
ncbi:bifunctional methylenetetrahydrofolate dehydrogenase/methenyltetrahydrofolate cyclohydrolase FolD [Dongia soli]|uniref:Bifunctional protein FolD n=1 Tax=Dongia soli TaxID=600628 RepID=A0ABU5E757_9PROT|nr:bifunctional methylenetetrahydrofolate dehydrogenase/methenyltetrahydrofolate cyclohydrolase FolD [Dongia soli]MDY0882133.1 bifunctional methylenetetrahydrofolate dehydrogenase/methenyltetrahydrofolate cyclohydrolase FolD [Dongia soli]